jgi:hypothetical protein
MHSRASQAAAVAQTSMKYTVTAMDVTKHARSAGTEGQDRCQVRGNNSAAETALHLAVKQQSCRRAARPTCACLSSPGTPLHNQSNPDNSQSGHNSAHSMAAQSPTTRMSGQVRSGLAPASKTAQHCGACAESNGANSNTARTYKQQQLPSGCHSVRLHWRRFVCASITATIASSAATCHRTRGMCELLSEVCAHNHAAVSCMAVSQAPSAHPQHTGYIPQRQRLPWLSCLRCLNSIK